MRAAPPQNLRDHLATYATAAAADPASAGGAAATYPPLFLGRRFREHGAAAICDTQRVCQLLVVVKRRCSHHSMTVLGYGDTIFNSAHMTVTRCC